ncbi:NYN domain-containing protein [Crocosphaera sp. XPORK-15E]|uniref:NYN domain-containing protein n=1 Tax=Crocosphaera sp. XPORK-15E TaxID=3110247 RepID=UPI002B218C80|nr:NYN domain-containing protein [Crocosphaera sp. XPORK-15E]MEA5536447.1 NYN domain-containing protein [Crocosphaera sp. XPORK-15E]
MSSHHYPLLLVDGYNIIGAWCSLKTTRDRHGLEQARRELVEALINYTAEKGYKTQVVFDSQYQRTPCSLEHHSSHLSIYFTAWTQTADTYIEKVCASFFHGKTVAPPRLIVATSDRDQQLTVVGYGAELMSAQVLSSDIQASVSQVKRKQRNSQRSQGRFLFNCLDAKSQERLARWR